MRRLFLPVLSGLCLACVLVSLSAHAATSDIPRPRASVGDYVYDFGQVPEGPEVVHRFAIENSGDAPLRVLSTEVTCSCTTLDYDAEIAPGATGYIEATLATKGDGGRSVGIGIDVYTNDPDQSRFRLVLKGKVEHVVNIQPAIVRFEGSAGERLTQEVVISPAAKYPFHILSIDARKGEDLSCAITEERSDPRPIYRLTVELNRTKKGHYFDSVIIRTDSPYQPEIRIGVFAKIV